MSKSIKNDHIDIIIPTRNRGELIVLTIQSILENSYPHFNLWIIDQSDNLSTKDALTKDFTNDKRLHYIHTQTTGSNLARSIGFIQGDAPYVLFTDDDCRVAPNWIQEMYQEFEDSQAWAVFGRIIEDKTFIPKIPSSVMPVNTDGLRMALKDDVNRAVYRDSRLNLSFGHGANMGICRQRLTEIGGFDNMLGNGGRFRSWPERDLGYRILRHHGKIVYTPKPIIYHRHWRGWQDTKKTHKNYAYGAGAAIGKYWRCGDKREAIYLLCEWILDQGVRQILSGLFKWRSSQKTQIGITHVLYPWQGLWESRNYAIDKERLIYQASHSEVHSPPSLNINIS